MSVTTESAQVAIVGPCSAGKSLLAGRLRAAGFRTSEVAQEHSYVPALWRRKGRPGALIFLDVSYEAARRRRPTTSDRRRLIEQQQRLADARRHADLYLDTSALAPATVADQVLAFLAGAGLEPAQK